MKQLAFATAALFFLTLVPVGSSGAAPVHWTLAKRYHLAFPLGTVSRKVSLSVTNANGIAISVKTPKRSTVYVQGLGACKRGSSALPIKVGITSHGLGSKVPIKLSMGSPNTCTASLTVSPSNNTLRSAIVSIWKR